MTTLDKCTWVAWSMTTAPTFKMEADPNGLTNDTWQIHQMEYAGSLAGQAPAEGTLRLAASSNGIVDINDVLSDGRRVPIFDMP